MNKVYSTKRLAVLFTYKSDRLSCIVYRKGVKNTFVQLQSYSIIRIGFKRLDHKAKIAALRVLLKSVRQSISPALKVTLKHKH